MIAGFGSGDMIATSAQGSDNRVLTRADLFQIWRAAITQDQTSDPKDVAVAELMEYYKLPKEEVERRCVDWEDISIDEWKAKDRSTPEGLLDFYQTQTSWIFDTMWYHAEQFTEVKPPCGVNVAEGLTRYSDLKPGHHFDFGAGPGTSSLFFHKLGWRVSLGDISTSFQEFAKWRLAKHGVPATFYDTAHDKLPAEEFDLITAFDVIAHVADAAKTIKELRASLKPNGYLVFNIDSRPMTERTAWHLYSAHQPILRLVRTLGFKSLPRISYFYVYKKVERGPLGTAGVFVADRIRYGPVVALAGKAMRGLGLRKG
jgi:2-polyprenyl-3-methyl-5-hydroxy-6-metoxy-1,4-benzoquinol methylase